jgi:hypothetical protein
MININKGYLLVAVTSIVLIAALYENLQPQNEMQQLISKINSTPNVNWKSG